LLRSTGKTRRTARRSKGGPDLRRILGVYTVEHAF